MKVDGNLSEIHIFHTDRGNEFKNETIEELLERSIWNAPWLISGMSL